jgi:4-hydroxy-2-oxoheptanedioate aldolase
VPRSGGVGAECDAVCARLFDAIYVGPADLAFSLGKTPKLDTEDPEQLGMYESVLGACRKRGVYPGIHCGEPAYAARMIRMA